MLIRVLSGLNCVRLVCFTIFTVCSINVSAESAIGVGVSGLGTSEYRGYEVDISPVPIVNISNDTFFIKGLSAGVNMFDNGINRLSLSTTYSVKKYDTDNSDNVNMQQLDNRDSTFMLDLTYSLNIQRHNLIFVASADILDETDGGYLLDASSSTDFFIANSVVISPSLGITWKNQALNNHYYGISASESIVSGYNEYVPDSSLTPYLGARVIVQLSDSISILIDARYTLLDDQITDSPMVNEDSVISGVIGFNYNF